MIRLVCSEGDFEGEWFEESSAFSINGLAMQDYFDLVQREAEAHVAFSAHMSSRSLGYRIHSKVKEHV